MEAAAEELRWRSRFVSKSCELGETELSGLVACVCMKESENVGQRRIGLRLTRESVRKEGSDSSDGGDAVTT